MYLLMHELPLFAVTNMDMNNFRLFLLLSMKRKHIFTHPAYQLDEEAAVNNVFYIRNSNLLALNESTNKYDVPIDKGLFSKRLYKFNEEIIIYEGIYRTVADFRKKCISEPIRAAYAHRGSTNSLILDCYDAYKRGECLASYANSPHACYNRMTGSLAVANCRLTVRHNAYSKLSPTMVLRAGSVEDYEKKDDKSFREKFCILPGEELLWDYGIEYAHYKNKI